MASKTTNYNLDMPGYDEIADIDVINGNMDKIDVQMKKNADSAQQSKDIVSDEYSATNTYAVGDYCIRENVLYKCKTAITTGEAFDSNKWVQTTCGTEVAELNSNLDVIGKCKNLLNPTLQTTTQNGVTFTNNGDGTYTLNGTNTQSAVLYIDIGEVEIPNKNLVILGSKNTNAGVYIKGTTATAYGNKITVVDSDKGVKRAFGLAIKQGATITNEIVKPMLCENLNATYDDFVPYTGDGETLTHDVAELKNDLSNKSPKILFKTIWANDKITGVPTPQSNYLLDDSIDWWSGVNIIGITVVDCLSTEHGQLSKFDGRVYVDTSNGQLRLLFNSWDYTDKPTQLRIDVAYIPK